MAADETIEVTAQDVASLDNKLTAFAETLPAAEQALFLDLVEQATAGPEDEVQGYAFHGGGIASMGLANIARVAKTPRRPRCRGRHGRH